MKENPSNRTPKSTRNPTNVSGLAFELLGLYLVLIGGGYKMDKYVGNHTPWFTLVGLFMAVMGTFYLLLKFSKK